MIARVVSRLSSFWSHRPRREKVAIVVLGVIVGLCLLASAQPAEDGQPTGSAAQEQPSSEPSESASDEPLRQNRLTAVA